MIRLCFFDIVSIPAQSEPTLCNRFAQLSIALYLLVQSFCRPTYLGRDLSTPVTASYY